MGRAMTATVRPAAQPRPPASVTPSAHGPARPRVLGPSAQRGLDSRAGFVAVLGPRRADACPPKQARASPGAFRRDETPDEVPRKKRSERLEPVALARDAAELPAHRLLPQALQPPPSLVAPHALARPELQRVAEQLVTRLRVGRSREGASVELQLTLGGRELDVRLLETMHGLEVHADGDDALRDAITRELRARGLPLAP
jgi:hypothetical protein